MTGTPSSLCAQCAGSGRTCCQRTRIFLTAADAARIASATGKPPESFCDHEIPDETPDACLALLDPVWSGILISGDRRRIVAHRPNGDCCFLDADGCVLDSETRPLLCRLYPFDYNNKTIKGVYAHLCPEAISRNIPLLLALLGMNRDQAEAWRAALYREIASEGV